MRIRFERSIRAWSNRLLVSHATSASGQPVGFIQLTAEEAEKLKGMPVMINLSTGVFVFPPTPGTHLLKVARHGFGFATHVAVEDSGRFVSSPKRDTNNVDASYIPTTRSRDSERDCASSSRSLRTANG